MTHPPPPGEPSSEGLEGSPAEPVNGAAPGAPPTATAASISPPSSGTRFLLATASFVIVVAGLKAAVAVFVPAALAFFLTVISLPLLFWLQRHRVPRGLAVLLTMLAVLVILSAVGLVVSRSLNEVGDVAPVYLERLYKRAQPLGERLEERGIQVSSWFTTELLDLDRLLNLTANTFAGVATALSVTVLVPLIMVFMLLEALGFRAKLAWALRRDTAIRERFAKINREIQHYLVIKTAVSLVTGVTVGLSLWLIGLDFPLFWGFVAFLFNYVPNIGSVVAAVPPVLLGLVQLGLTRSLLIALVYVAVNMLLGNLLEPNLMGRRLRLSPLVVLLSLIFWGWVWGPVGMLLAVPLTMILKIMLENTERFAWLAKLMDHPKAALAAAPAAGPPAGEGP